ncbi:imidazoleglycerol-phosphate dehydratase [Leptolyngbya valderiana BDU 20041]|nr:imidazoleglycerol-phosphate dehydratase [Leptolyngbya valderiana BDU 20041]
MTDRRARIERTTRETKIEASIDLDGVGNGAINTGIGFLDHMLSAVALHGRVDLELACRGDLDVDDHHTVEDVAIVVGQLVDQALGDRTGIVRFAHAYAPLDEALARVVVDLSGRPSATIALGLEREMLGSVACENLTHWFVSFATAARCALHVDVLRGENDHHRAEAAFKALALALRGAIAMDPRPAGVPSTKGVL